MQKLFIWARQNTILHVVIALLHFGTFVYCADATAHRENYIASGRLPIACLTVNVTQELRMASTITVNDECGNYDILSVCTALHALTMCFHLAYASIMRGNARWLRWIEYFMSAPLVFTNFAITTGIRERNALLLIGIVSAIIQPFGYLCETWVLEPLPVSARTRRGRVNIDSQSADRNSITPVTVDEDEADDLIPRGSPEDDMTDVDGLSTTPTSIFNTLFSVNKKERAELRAAIVNIPGWAGVIAIYCIVLQQWVSIRNEAPDFVTAIVSVQFIFLSLFGLISVYSVMSGKPLAPRVDAAYAYASFTSKIVPTLIYVSAIRL